MQAGEVIKYLRIKKKLTQDELGDALGVKKSAVQKYESGVIQNLKMDTLRRLCDLFDVPPHVFTHPETVDNLEEIVDFYQNRLDWKASVLIRFNHRGVEKLKDYIQDLAKIEEYLVENQD